MIKQNTHSRILVTCGARIPSVELGAIIPLTHLQKQGLCEINYKDEGLLSLADIAWCDIVFIARGASVQSVWAADTAKKLQRMVLGYWDDDLLSIPSYSLAFDYFSRPETKENIDRLFNMTDSFFSPNSKLAAKISALHGKEVKVLPVGFGPGKLKPPRRKSHDVPIIGFAGGADNIHMLNSFLGPVLEVIVGNDIHCNIHIVGPKPNFIDKLKDRAKYTSYIANYYDYLDLASRLNWDIGLAPQAASEFTTYKFYNKLLEYTSIGCAGIYSKLEPYTNVIQDGITGLLADNEVGAWRDAIVRLLKEPELRFKIASNAYEIVQSSHNRRVVVEQYAIALGPFLSYRAPEIRHGLKALIIGYKVIDKIFPLVSAIFNTILYPSTIRKALGILRQQGLSALFSKIAGRLKLRNQYILHLLAKRTTGHALILPESALAHKYCVGKGLEIGGAAHNPFGLNTLNVDFTNSMETVFKKEEIRSCGKAMKVDIIAYGDNIPLPDGSQDFVVSSHVLEHFPNPIKALLEWDRLIRPGGIIFMIVPHKERTFDKRQARTSLRHLIEDFLSDNKAFHKNPSGHDHCWITEDILALANWMIDTLHVKWEIAEVQDVDDKVGNGFTIVIKKKKNRVLQKCVYITDSRGRARKAKP
jgi:SAM-dependent methyltransferase/glycosyltransferase involved in cell wall biosynthesis